MKTLPVHMRIGALSVTDDDVTSRKAAVTELVASWGKAQQKVAAVFERAGAIAAALVLEAPPLALASEVEAVIQKTAPAFLASERPFDVGVCAAAAAVDLFDGKPNADGYTTADVLATALWSALSFRPAMQDAKRESLRLEVLEAARTRALTAAEQGRTRSGVDDFGTFVPVADEAETVAAFKKATGNTIKALRRNAALDREEIDFLWWTLVSRSKLLKRPLQALDEPIRLVVSGIEAATYLRRLPCSVHRELVLRSLDANPTLKLSTLLDSLGESRKAIGAKYAESAIVSENKLVFPLLNCLATGNADDGGADVELGCGDWGARALLEAGLVQIQSTGIALL